MSSKSVLSLIKLGAGFRKLLNENSGLRRFISRRFPDRGNEVAPYMYSDDPVYHKFIHKQIELLEKSGNFDPKYDSDGNVVNAVDGSYESIKTVSGYHSSPRPIGITSNIEIRADKELPNTWVSERAKKIYEEVFVHMFVRRTDASLPVNTKSTSAMPQWTKDPYLKLKGMNDVLDYMEANRDRKPTLAELSAHKIYLFPVVGYRSQVDPPSKKRFVSVGEDKQVEANKQTEFKDMYRTRERAIYAYSSNVNMAFQTLFCGIQKFTFTEYEKTFKVRFPIDVSHRMNRFPARCTVDVSSYDTTVPKFIMEFFFELLEKYEILSTCALTMFRYMMSAPSISPCPFDEPQEWSPTGDYLNPDDYSLDRGLPSGICIVALFGRWNMTSEMYQMLDHVNKNVLDNVGMYLKHEAPDAAIVNSSDDNFCGAQSDAMLVKWMLAPSHFQIEREPFLKYLGWFYNVENKLLVPYPNIITSMFINRDCPERSIGLDEDDQRAGWYTGWKSVKELAASHPLYEEAYNIKNAACEYAYGRSYESQMLMKQEPLKFTGVLTMDERTFLINPDAVHYKIDITSLSEEILALRYQAQTPDKTKNWAKKIAGPGIIWT